MSNNTAIEVNNSELGLKSKFIAYFVSLLGAIGSAIQNYVAVEMFIKGIAKYTHAMRGLAIGLGGVCSGMINFFINVELLESFLKRITGKLKMPKLTFWQKFRYWAGNLVFVVTGILFGMTAFTIGMGSPLMIMAIFSGVFVSIIMIIQEVEIWLQSFDEDETQTLQDAPKSKTLIEIFNKWKKSLSTGKALGHAIAIGNVIALSLLFTLGLAEVLVLSHLASLPALIIGAAVAFTFGAFTEFYFYNAFLAPFCQDFSGKWQEMLSSKYSTAGIILTTCNALVNCALTFSGVQLLFAMFVSVGFAATPAGLVIAVGGISAFFAGAASFLLGVDFWIRKMAVKPVKTDVQKEVYVPQCQNTNEPKFYGSLFKSKNSSADTLHLDENAYDEDDKLVVCKQ